MKVYYNDADVSCVAWLRELIKHGVLPDGEVDGRSIKEVMPEDVAGFDQCHFFAGIGGWAYALRLAGWPDDRAVWTGSCPCQPFSAAGKRLGTADERHLWPEFFRLIAERQPPTVFGEQVASKDGRLWLAGVRSDLEVLEYAVGAADLCAAGVGAPHIRQRLFWVADANGVQPEQPSGEGARSGETTGRRPCGKPARSGASCGLADTDREGLLRGFGGQQDGGYGDEPLYRSGLGDTDQDGRGAARAGFVDATERDAEPHGRLGNAEGEQVGRARQSWQDGVWLDCLDGKARRVEPGIFPLADGVSGRVGRLRGYGNAIVPQVAAEFVAAFLGT